MEPTTFGIPWPEFNAGLFYYDTILCGPSDVPLTLLKFYSSTYQQSASKEGWLQRIQSGQIKVDQTVTTSPDLELSIGARLEYHRFPWKEPSAPYQLQIVYEDEDVLVLNKPSGLQVLPGGLFQQRTVLQQLQWQKKSQWSNMSEFTSDEKSCSTSVVSESWEPSPVHRLGRGTSGILLCAKSPDAKSKLAADMARNTADSETGGMPGRRFQKTYRALAVGMINDDEIVVQQKIGVVKYSGVAGGLYMASPTGKPACSKIVVLWRNETENCTLVEVHIFTGRPHQIRIHLASIGHPLVGDPLYIAGGIPYQEVSDKMWDEHPAEDGGYRKPNTPLPGDCGYQLHACQLNFHHPKSNKEMVVVAPLPPNLKAPFEEGQIWTSPDFEVPS